MATGVSPIDGGDVKRRFMTESSFYIAARVNRGYQSVAWTVSLAGASAANLIAGENLRQSSNHSPENKAERDSQHADHDAANDVSKSHKKAAVLKESKRLVCERRKCRICAAKAGREK